MGRRISSIGAWVSHNDHICFLRRRCIVSTHIFHDNRLCLYCYPCWWHSRSSSSSPKAHAPRGGHEGPNSEVEPTRGL